MSFEKDTTIKYMFREIHDITPEVVRELGLEAILFDLDNTTVSKKTRDYLSKAEKEGRVNVVSYELPKSFIVCGEKGNQKVYLSQISTTTLLKRTEENL